MKYYDVDDQYGDGITHGFYAASSSSPLQTFDYPGSLMTVLTGINDAGWIVGNYAINDANGNEMHCLLWKSPYASSAPVSFDMPGESDGEIQQCSGINGLGQIVAWIGDITTAFEDDAEAGNPGNPANVTVIPLPDDVFEVMPYGINNNGIIAGEMFDHTDSELGFLVNSSVFISIINPVEADFPLEIVGINDEVQMVSPAYFFSFYPIQP